MQIHGVGPSTANKLWNEGYHSIDVRPGNEPFFCVDVDVSIVVAAPVCVSLLLLFSPRWCAPFALLDIHQLLLLLLLSLWSQDLRRFGQARLSEAQCIGLRHYEDFQQRVPRCVHVCIAVRPLLPCTHGDPCRVLRRIETAGVERVIQLVANMILPGVICTAVGSYRRYAPGVAQLLRLCPCCFQYRHISCAVVAVVKGQP